MADTYTLPQVLVFQEFETVSTEITDPLRAFVIGPNKDLHRYSEADEKSTIDVGQYDPTIETCYLWPGRDPGGIVDQDAARVFIDEALLKYFEDLLGSGSIVAAVAGKDNWIASDAVNFKTNPGFPRDAALFDRDVQAGDIVDIRGIVMGDSHELRTYVAGFASNVVPSIVGPAFRDPDNAPDQAFSESISKIAGINNCVAATVDGSAYDGLEDGDISEVYTIEVIESSAGGDHTTAVLRVTSASGRDDDTPVTPAAIGMPTEIGDRGLLVTFSNTSGSSCSSLAFTEGFSDDDLLEGQIWQASVSQAFEAPLAKSGGTYDDTEDDTYIVEVTRGGNFVTGDPLIKVTTARGLDASGPTVVPADNVFVAIGTKGVLIKFHGSGAFSSISSSSGESVGISELDGVAGLRKGDKYFVEVVGKGEGAIRTLVLGNNLSDELKAATDLDLKLYMKRNIEVQQERIEAPPILNWTTEETQICLAAGITSFEPTWTDGGVPLALPVLEGAVFIEFCEFLAQLTNTIEAINDTGDLNEIPGPLDPGNPLKYAVFKALQNSNGTFVKYLGIRDPSIEEQWIDAIAKAKGREDVYGFVPITRDQRVLDLFQGHVNSESAPERGRWRVLWTTTELKVYEELIGAATSDDDLEVLATVEDDPDATGTQYTLMKITSGNAELIQANVQPGDVVRYLFTTDGFGNIEFQEFIVDIVINEDTLRLFDGLTSAVGIPIKVEIIHNLNQTEQARDIGEQASRYSDRRVRTVWPDLVEEIDDTQIDGINLVAALAGLRSGVVPHQGLTNVEIFGFDSVTRTTELFDEDDLNEMARLGVYIVTEDKDGTTISRHALTTDNLDLLRREEMITSNVDSISFLVRRRLEIFIGRTNVTPSNLKLMQIELLSVVEFLKQSGFTERLGAQLIDGEIERLEQHPILKDRVIVDLRLIVPSPLNNIEVHEKVSVGTGISADANSGLIQSAEQAIDDLLNA